MQLERAIGAAGDASVRAFPMSAGAQRGRAALGVNSAEFFELMRKLPRRLDRRMPVKGQYEMAIRAATTAKINDSGISLRVYHEPIKFHIEGHEPYPADFIIPNLRVDGKPVLIEAHNEGGKYYRSRMVPLKETFGDMIHIILVESLFPDQASRRSANMRNEVTISMDGRQLSILLGDAVSQQKGVDELWLMPKIRLHKRSADGGIKVDAFKGMYAVGEDFEIWTRLFRKGIANLLERGGELVKLGRSYDGHLAQSMEICVA